MGKEKDSSKSSSKKRRASEAADGLTSAPATPTPANSSEQNFVTHSMAPTPVGDGVDEGTDKKKKKRKKDEVGEGEEEGETPSKKSKKDKKDKSEKKEKKDKEKEKKKKKRGEDKENEGDDMDVDDDGPRIDTKPIGTEGVDAMAKGFGVGADEILNPIAKPLADKKMNKKVLRTVKKASKARHLKRGVKEVVKALRKGEKGVVVLAADISPLDIISHLPVLCEESENPYIFVPSKEMLGIASSTKRPTSCVLLCAEIKRKIKPGAEGKKNEREEETKEFKSAFVELSKEIQELNNQAMIAT